MKREHQSFLKEVFYKYWMERVPELDEFEAIDHLEWELRSMGLVPTLEKCKTSRQTKRRLTSFLKKKGVKTWQ